VTANPNVFRTAGLVIGDRPGNVPVDAATIYAKGYRWVGIQGCNGAQVTGGLDDYKSDDPRWRAGMRPHKAYQNDYLRPAGLKSIPWQKLYGGDEAAVRAQAQAAARFIYEVRPDGFMPNPEDEFKQDGNWRNAVYVDALLSSLAALGVDPAAIAWAWLPLASATPGNHYTWDVESWKRLPGAFCVPEAYWAPNDNVSGAASWYRPSMAADEWLGAHGWPADRFALLCGWWNGNFAAPSLYFVDMQKVKAKYPGWKGGYSVYEGEQMGAQQITDFAGGIPTYAAKDIPAAPAPVLPDPVLLEQQIIALCDSWLVPAGGVQTKSRLRNIRRIAASGTPTPNTAWNTAQPGVTSALDSAGL
jgi:hypothetical protein